MTTEETTAVLETKAPGPPPTDRHVETVQAIRDVVIMLVLVGGAIALAFTDHGELAATALGGALAYAVPNGARRSGVPHQVAAIGLAIVFGALAGCGGAIGAQARAITVSTVALEGVHRVSMAAVDRELAACEVPSCPGEVEARWQPASDAYTVATSTLHAWLEALEVARIAGDGGEVVAALAVAAARLIDDWRELAAVLRRLDVDVPDPPPLLLAAAAAIGGGL